MESLDKNPLVSIIMPAFNSSKTICDSIHSVQSQYYPNWELLVVDDCSTDNTSKILQNFTKQDERIHYFRLLVNGGAAISRNLGIKEAKGRFIAFLDADDIWLPEKLHKQIQFMLNNNVFFSYSAYQKFDKHGNRGIVIPPEFTNYKKLLCGNIIGCLTAVYDAEALGKCYFPNIRKRQDMGLWLEILKKIDIAQGLPEVLAKYRCDNGMSANKMKVLSYQWKLYRNIEKLSFLSSLKYFLIYAIRGYLKSRK